MRRVLGVLMVCLGVAGGGLLVPASASAEPELSRYVRTIRCDSADPWPGGRLIIPVDVYANVRFPSDGLPGPAIELQANNPRSPGILPNLTEYTTETTVRWRNLRTGRTGAVRVPARGHRIAWTAVIHPGAGRVSFTIRQKIGALAFVPMVNPQYSVCRGSV